MEGTIKIDLDGAGVRIKTDVRHISKFEIFMLFDTLCDSFKLNEFDKKVLGLMFTMGGVEKATGGRATKVEVNRDLIELLNKMKEKNNETDAL